MYVKRKWKKYTIYHDLDKGVVYKEYEGNYEKLSFNDTLFYTDIAKINDNLVEQKEIRVKRAKVKKMSGRIVLAAIGLSVIATMGRGLYSNYQEKEPIRIYKNSEKSTEDILELFNYAMEKNLTLRDEMKENILEYLRVYVKECTSLGIDNDDIYFKIVKKLSTIDFTDQSNVYLSDLSHIFDFTNGDFIALELYVHLDGTRASSQHELLSGLLFFNEDEKVQVLSGKKLKLEMKGKVYLVNLNDLTKNTSEFYDLVYEDICEHLDVSDDDKVAIRSNIFDPIFEEYNENSKISVFYEYHDDELLNVSYREYYKKLASLIYQEAGELDYSNKVDRELIYLYAEALKINFGEQWCNDPTRFILDSIIDNYYPFLEPVITPYNLLRYLNGSSLELDNLDYFSDLALMGKKLFL